MESSGKPARKVTSPAFEVRETGQPFILCFYLDELAVAMRPRKEIVAEFADLLTALFGKKSHRDVDRRVWRAVYLHLRKGYTAKEASREVAGDESLVHKIYYHAAKRAQMLRSYRKAVRHV